MVRAFASHQIRLRSTTTKTIANVAVMRTLPFLVVLLVAACGDDSSRALDAALDAPTQDTAQADVSAANQDSSTDSAIADAGDDVPFDAADDAGEDTGGAEDAGDVGGDGDAGEDASVDAGCAYLDDVYITDCETGYERLRRFVSTSDPIACPEFFTIGGERFATQDEAMASLRCAVECLRSARNSVSLLRCGRRTGFISFVDDMGCASADVLETADGIFASSDEWDAAAPCP